MKPVLCFSYHDPELIYASSLVRNIDLLKKHFSKIIVSVTPITFKNNSNTVEFLENNGCYIVHNENDNAFAEHFISGINKVFSLCIDDEYVFYGFIDRILYALETDYKDIFLKDAASRYAEDCILFSRSEYAWEKHPRDYYKLENIVGDIGQIFLGKKIDWIWCACLFKVKKLIKISGFVNNECHPNDISILAKYLFFVLVENISLRNIFVDWLEWEDPFWDKNKKASNEMSVEEKKFRLRYCIDAIEYFLK